MTKIVGLTGGIGSGKTTIAKFFAELSVPVYIADEEAKKLLYMPEVAEAVKAAFGDSVLTESLPDRRKLSAIVFNNPEKLKVLNGIIHPKVQGHFAGWVAHHEDAPFVIKEAAILFESGSYRECDKIILVTAPLKTRIERVMQRDGLTEKEIMERVGNQWDEKRKEALSDFVIYNLDISESRLETEKIVNELQKK